ncbi:Uncharacterised protein [Mycobacteroides abscessus subsp. abscessus]|nr:Uncharacterised protein [Mycobacteroides abscessus subsp. abscessus]SKV73326.1 Uncharacterised protein [Mycobacteroides abscessus subsp. abscessus]
MTESRYNAPLIVLAASGSDERTLNTFLASGSFPLLVLASVSNASPNPGSLPNTSGVPPAMAAVYGARPLAIPCMRPGL